MPEDRITRMKAAHEVLCEFPFKIKQLEKGYADQVLRIDLDTNEMKILPVTRQMKNGRTTTSTIIIRWSMCPGMMPPPTVNG